MENITYRKLESLVKKIMKLCTKGWILLDEHGDQTHFVLSTPFSDRCIAEKYSESGWGTICTMGKTDNFGSKTLKEEYELAYEALKRYKIIKPEHAITITSLKGESTNG